MSNVLMKNDDNIYYLDKFSIDGKYVNVRKNRYTKIVEAFINEVWKTVTEKDVDRQYRVEFNYSPYELEFSYNGGKTWWTYTDEKYMTEWEKGYLKKEIEIFEEWQLDEAIEEEERRANDPEYQERIAEQYAEWITNEEAYEQGLSSTNHNRKVVDISDFFKNDDSPSWTELCGDLAPQDEMVSPELVEPNYLKYFEILGNSKKFQPIWFAKDVSTNHMKSFYDGAYLYRYKDGVYLNDGENYLRKISVSLLDNEYRKNRIEEARHYIESESYIQRTSVNIFDDYINVKNGLLNWRTGELKEHTPEKQSTIQFPVIFDPNANDPIILDFINSVLAEDTHLTLFEMMGYFLIPTLEYEKIFLFTGTGSNGKSVLIKAVEAMIGKQNISKIKIQDLEGDKSRFKIAELYGKVLNCFTDIPADTLNSTGNLKVLASGEGLNAEKKGKDPFDFEPFCKLLFSANELPKTNDNSDGFFRRIMVFPFTRKFADGEKDTKLIHKLTRASALSTLFNYALEGLRRLEKQGEFSYSKTIAEQVKAYQIESDVIMLFIDQECVIGSVPFNQESCRIECKRLYATYCAWCKQSGFKPETVTHFNKHIKEKLKEKIYTKKARTLNRNSVPFWYGIRV
jgi:P4 family phage/plasmid primase-like protien